MINRKRKRRIALVALLAFVLGTTAFAYAASLTFNGGTNARHAGTGSGVISGYNVTNIHYTLDSVDPASITSVSFSLTPDTATTVRAKLNNMSAYTDCSETGTTWNCPDVTGDAYGATNLQVAAAD